MKILCVLFVAAIVFTITQCSTKNESYIEGTWELVTGKIEFADQEPDIFAKGPDFRMIKVYNKTHFSTMRQDLEKDYTFFNGGTYTLQDNKYTEQLEFFPDNHMLDTSLSYEIELKNDTLVIAGPIRVNEKYDPSWTLHEVYSRVKEN